jgi:DNA-binding beta-propeller fold protein YncE
MSKSLLKTILLTSTLLAAGGGVAIADTAWVAGPTTIKGSLRAGTREAPIQPGGETVLTVRNVKPGATITVLRGAELLTPQPLTADDKGSVDVPIKVPADAELGLQPLTVISNNPAGTMLVNLKLSKVIPASNEAGFELKSAEVGDRAYQAAVSTDGKLFVTSARGKESESRLIRLDARTLAVEAEAKLATSADPKNGLVDVFGIGVDNANGRVWTTNTLNNTVSVYDARDLSVVKVFPENSIPHPFDVVIDEENNRAYVNAALTGDVEVYDAGTLEHVDTLRFDAAAGRAVFGSMNLDLDAKAGRLYSVSRDTPWAGWIDLKTGKSTTFEVPQLAGGSSVAHDPETGRIYLVGQDSDNLVVLDKEGKFVSETTIGAGGLSVVWDAKAKKAYAATRAGGTVTVLDGDGKIEANLPLGDLPNHLAIDADGAVYAVTMYGPKDQSQTGTVTRITAR